MFRQGPTCPAFSRVSSWGTKEAVCVRRMPFHQAYGTENALGSSSDRSPMFTRDRVLTPWLAYGGSAPKFGAMKGDLGGGCVMQCLCVTLLSDVEPSCSAGDPDRQTDRRTDRQAHKVLHIQVLWPLCVSSRQAAAGGSVAVGCGIPASIDSERTRAPRRPHRCLAPPRPLSKKKSGKSGPRIGREKKKKSRKKVRWAGRPASQAGQTGLPLESPTTSVQSIFPG